MLGSNSNLSTVYFFVCKVCISVYIFMPAEFNEGIQMWAYRFSISIWEKLSIVYLSLQKLKTFVLWIGKDGSRSREISVIKKYQRLLSTYRYVHLSSNWFKKKWFFQSQYPTILNERRTFSLQSE